MESDNNLKRQSNGWYATPILSPSTPSSSTSSSPSTTAFVTPASSLGTDPSNPPSPSLGVLGLPACLTAVTALSMRPAPPSPALSKRQSAMSGRLSRSLSRPVSRPLSGVAGALDPPATTVTAKAPSTTITAQPLCQEPDSTEPPTPLIKIRDYAFQLTDDRFRGLGPFVPKWNRVERLNRVLLEAMRNDEEMQERRARKERRRQKREKREKRRKKKTINGWSDSDESEDGEREEDNNKNNNKDESDSGDASSSSGSGSESQGGDDDGMPGADEEEDEKYMGGEGGWGGFRFGRLSWNNGGGSQSSLHKDGQQAGGLAGFPSRMDFDRNFGEEEGADVDDSQSASPPEPYPFEHAGVVDEHFRGYQDEEGYHYNEYQDYKDYQEPHEPPLLPGLYRALYAFEPEGAAEMGLVEDQVVRVVGRGGGVGWAVVIDEREGKKGGHALVPESYLDVVRVDEDDADADAE